MRALSIYFAWYDPTDCSVDDGDMEDLHELDDSMTSEEVVKYVVSEIGWFGLPSIDGKSYVCDEVDFEDLDEEFLRVRYATLTGFSDEELQRISELMKSR